MPRIYSQAQRFHTSGFEDGSVGQQMSPSERKAFRLWLDRVRSDAGIYERQLAGVNARYRGAYADMWEA